MEKFQNQVITISRQYAAYGRTVASALAKNLGLEFYDRDFVKKTVAESGYSQDDIEREGESMSRGSKWLNNFLNGAASYSSSYDGIFNAQRDVILKLAKEPCIIVGRCSDYILKEAKIPAFHIFLYADLDTRLRRAGELNPGKTSEELKKLVEKHDKLRSTYYKYYTGRNMGESSNYTICLDTGTIGVEKCVEILTDLLA